ncbi:hypothetical protein [Streptomyces silvensis]|uniref:Uncharacterized protein n=1 Tax=Streptomyces silvensis TaxID=1765722 RepID=A0A0W7X271_9ACTN|nr:hypothetical protein [Streptomyces silvensis]KUF16934.1 hypothetical protein AT728_23725 [Streptomyces silvensis]
MFTARNPRWWLRAAGAAGVCALTAALVAGAPRYHAPAEHDEPRAAAAPDAGADPWLDAVALTVAVAVSTAVLLLLRRRAPGRRADS